MTEQEEADRYEEDFFEAEAPPESPRGVLYNTFDSPDTHLNKSSKRAFEASGSASADAALERVADQGAQGFVDALEPKQKRARTSKKENSVHEADFNAVYKVTEHYPNGRVKLGRVSGDGPTSFVCAPDKLCSISPFVEQTVIGHLVNGKPTVRGISAAKKANVTFSYFNKFLPEGYPKISNNRWRPGAMKKSDLPARPEYFDPIIRPKSYFTLLPVYGYKVLDQLSDGILDEIVNKFTDDQRYLFLASTYLRIPVHIACAPVLLPTPTNDNRAIAILEACKLYKHMMECYEHRQPLTIPGPDYAQSMLEEFGMVERVNQNFRLKAPYAIRSHIESVMAHYDVDMHHFDAFCNLWPFMLSLCQSDKKTLFLFPSDLVMELAKQKLHKTDFACALLTGKTADNINQAFGFFDQIVVMFAERVVDAHWRLFDACAEETLGKKLICVGDRHHFLTVPFGMHYFGGYSHLWTACENKTEHPWEQPQRAELWQPGVHELLIQGDFSALFGTPFKDFQIHRGDCTWQDIKRCVKYLAKNQRDEHTLVVPSNTVILCGPSVLKKAQIEFLTLDDTRKWDAGRKTPVFSYIDLFASKVSNVSGTKVDLKQKVPMQWDLEHTDPSQFRLLNLTTIYQCFAIPKEHVVFVIDLLTTRRDIAVALKFAEVGKGKVDVFWAPEIPSSQRQFSKLN